MELISGIIRNIALYVMPIAAFLLSILAYLKSKECMQVKLELDDVQKRLNEYDLKLKQLEFNEMENNMDNTFMTPEGHKKFAAKKLFNEMGKIQWGAVAYIEENGGGPKGNHTHSDNHIFIVVEGEVKVVLGEVSHIVKTDEMFFVNGMTPHSIWNNGKQTAKVIKISVAP